MGDFSSSPGPPHRTQAPCRQRWQALIRDQDSSGITQAEFCREQGLDLRAFRLWKYQRLRQRDPLPVEVPAFVPVQIEDDLPGDEAAPAVGDNSGLEILVGEQRIRVTIGFDEGTLQRVVAALAASTPC